MAQACAQLTVRDTAVWVRYGDGSVSESAWDRPRLKDFDGSVPWREARGRRGQAHYSGLYVSATTGGFVAYESRLELARVLLADFDQRVRWIYAQPFRLVARVDGCVRSHVPDLLLVTAAETGRLVNVLRGVHAAVPKGFRVNILKPDSVLRKERARVTEVKKTFSGGQQLTAAILLYCTMAALRANNQGRKRDRHAGLLFLDNPIGKANADHLLDLQCSVAEALGVQLIYTTGLFDATALRRFPLIVRLRNDADLRAARRYLSVDPQIRAELDKLPAADGTGALTAARMFHRDPSTEQQGDATAS